MLTLTEKLAEVLMRPVGAAERRRAKQHLRDWIACAVLGTRSEAGAALARYGIRLSPGPCTAIGVGTLDAPGAAFVNGGLGNIFELDDTHRMSILHPGDTVLPAALAVCERDGRDAETLLEAIVRGYEATIRVGMAAGRSHYRQWYSTATCGVFGAAAAAASAMNLDREAMAQALSNAGMQFSGVWQCRLEPGFAKQLATARAAQSGVAAAELASAGFIGPKQILEGELGFFATTDSEGNSEPIVGGRDAPWKIQETSFKPWPACRATHPVIEAALMARSKIDPSAIEAVDVRIFDQAIVLCDNETPKTSHEGRFSLQHCVAVAILHGEPRLTHFEQPFLRNDAVSALRQKVAVSPDLDLTAAFPMRLGVSMRIQTSDGHETVFDLWTAKGDPENPMTDRELKAKAEELITSAGTQLDVRSELLSRIESLSGREGLTGLSSALRRACVPVEAVQGDTPEPVMAAATS